MYKSITNNIFDILKVSRIIGAEKFQQQGNDCLSDRALIQIAPTRALT